MIKIPRGFLGSGSRIRNSGNFSCPNNALTAVTFDIIDFDNLGVIDLINRNTKIIISKIGWYVFIGGSPGGFASNTTNERALYLSINDTTNIARQVKGANDGSPIAYQTVTGMYYCQAGDYIKLLAYQNSGGNLNLVHATLAAIQVG